MIIMLAYFQFNNMNYVTMIYTKIILISAVFVPYFAHADEHAQIENPLNSATLQEFLGELVNALVYLSIPVIVFFIIYAGFLFVTAGGDPGKIESAQKTALYTVIGAAIILGAQLIASILEGTATNFDI